MLPSLSHGSSRFDVDDWRRVLAQNAIPNYAPPSEKQPCQVACMTKLRPFGEAAGTDGRTDRQTEPVGGDTETG